MKKINHISNERIKNTSTPINTIIPAIANSVPNQNERRGLFLKNKNAIKPTHIGARLVSNVPCVALVSWIDRFQNAISAANSIPHKAANNPVCTLGTFNDLVTVK